MELLNRLKLLILININGGVFTLSNGIRFGKNVTIFSADMSSSIHIDNKQKDILILSKGPTNVLDGTMLTAKKEFSINFTEQ